MYIITLYLVTGYGINEVCVDSDNDPLRRIFIKNVNA